MPTQERLRELLAESIEARSSSWLWAAADVRMASPGFGDTAICVEQALAAMSRAVQEAYEEAAKVADEFGGMFDLPDPDKGPFSQQDDTVAQCQKLIAQAIRALSTGDLAK